MKKNVWFVCLLISLGVVHGSAQADDPVRVERTYKVFSTALDKLLLETPHVYIRVDHKTDSLYLQNFGPVFTGHISITSSASLPEIVEKWSQWFKNEDGQIIIKKPSIGNTDIPEPGEKGSESGEASASESKMKTSKEIKAEDQKRLEEMQTSIQKFSREVMEVMLDFGPIIQGTQDDDRIAVIFHVADDAFFNTYHTRTLQVQIEMKDLMKLSGKSPGDGGVERAFQWNVDMR
ncbi:MAG TPA: hypothetical protein PLV45_14105 [bacterium]|nr:hypothetical protein [bacterium]